MEDRDWLIIQALHKEKNITRAAQALYMSQPALTSRLQHIEREFGVRIVQRSTKGIRFTPQGEYLAGQAGEFINSVERVKNEVKGLFSEDSGTLEIGASNYITMYTLPQLLEDFQQVYPAVKFRVVTDWSKNIFSLVYNQKIQVGFVSIDYGGAKHMQLLYEEPVCIAYHKSFELADLPDMPRIVYESDYLLKSQLDKWWREHFTVPPEISMRVSKLENCRQMIAHGLGYALMPSRIIGDDKHIFARPLVHKDGKPVLRKTWMLYGDLDRELPIVRHFIDFVSEYKF